VPAGEAVEPSGSRRPSLHRVVRLRDFSAQPAAGEPSRITRIWMSDDKGESGASSGPLLRLPLPLPLSVRRIHRVLLRAPSGQPAPRDSAPPFAATSWEARSA
jgi:hypothetical protein